MSKSAWSEESVIMLNEMYTGDNSELPKIAAKLQKSIPMVRSKLVSQKTYVKEEAPKKVGGASSVRKSQLVTQIEKLLGAEKGDFESFEKASKLELEALIEKITK